MDAFKRDELPVKSRELLRHRAILLTRLAPQFASGDLLQVRGCESQAEDSQQAVHCHELPSRRSAN